MEAVFLIVVLFLAYANGANDNFKGVATLYGCGSASYRTAIVFGTAAVFAGSILSLFVARGLIAGFSGEGLVPDQIIGNGSFLPAVGFGTAVTVMLAARLGLPVSTTHSLVGGLLGAGWMAVGADVNYGRLGAAFAAPLLLSPLAAFALIAIIYPFFSYLQRRLQITRDSCICIGMRGSMRPAVLLVRNLEAPDAAGARLTLELGDTAECRSFFSGRFLGVSTQNLLNVLHYISAASVSFARGLNDAPKIAALLLASSWTGLSGSGWPMVAVALAMAAGGLLSARRVAETMSHRITPLDHGQGLSANLVTAVLVIFASGHGLPVSTTHVSVGSISAIGALTGRGNAGMIRGIVLAWVVTLPVAMMAGALSYMLLAG
ncbi:MAG: inorganic phosphate transporter [Gammaproteobacteria bacterium]|jgi:PiT family inorganic phosphate transporter|nr:inorganic phosphate transporter [Gammaproteobacteria bacterium]